MIRRYVAAVNEAEVQAGLAATPGYRYADVVGGQLFVAGQVPRDGAGNLVGVGDPSRQAVACLDNLAVVLGVHGFAVADIHRLVVYVVGDQGDLSAVWRAVLQWFGGEVPPATLLGVNLLGYREQRVEVDATIVRARET